MFLYIITDDICQYWKNLDKMILSSPNFPKWYNIPPFPSCDWLISAQEGFIIALEFNYFHVSNLLDFVKIFVTVLYTNFITY